MKRLLKACVILVSVFLLFPILALPLGAVDQIDEYTQELLDKGFPLEYAKKLTELHYLHPAWKFEPLLVSEMKEQYSWEYIMKMETDNQKRNLISKGSSYAAYRHETNTQLYDSGWYQASYKAVEYFMDPRNFLNEKDIFQFQDLKFSDTVTVAAVETALSGTFMANAILFDDVTYAEYLMQIGEELGVDPLHLAARLRQEQGTSGANPQISGACGDKLWYYYTNRIQTEGGKNVLSPSSGYSKDTLLCYNGLYNYFNIQASGTGYFAIYLGAMKEAQTGTPEKASEWGGSGSWDTPAKAIYGGAYKLTSKYVNDYQNTLYLQKFNVDPRSSRNFWGQYMQNVGAAVSEARTIYRSLYSMDCLDLPYTFLIPVYAGIPEECPDPADGGCSTYSPSDGMIAVEVKLCTPQEHPSKLDSAVYIGGLQMIEGTSLTIKGNCFSTVAFEKLFVSVDGGTAVELTAEYDKDALPTLLDKGATGEYPNTFRFDCSTLAEGEHTISIYGRVQSTNNGCQNHLLAVASVTVEPLIETDAPATSDTVTEGEETDQTESSDESSKGDEPQQGASSGGCRGMGTLWIVTISMASALVKPIRRRI